LHRLASDDPAGAGLGGERWPSNTIIISITSGAWPYCSLPIEYNQHQHQHHIGCMALLQPTHRHILISSISLSLMLDNTNALRASAAFIIWLNIPLPLVQKAR
jgi:hypothetical protein